MVTQFEAVFQVTIPPGYNKHISHMAHALEPLRVLHKPLAFYAAVHVVSAGVDTVVTCMGFRKRTVGGVTCWVRLPPSRNASARTEHTWVSDPVAVVLTWTRAVYAAA